MENSEILKELNVPDAVLEMLTAVCFKRKGNKEETLEKLLHESTDEAWPIEVFPVSLPTIAAIGFIDRLVEFREKCILDYSKTMPNGSINSGRTKVKFNIPISRTLHDNVTRKISKYNLGPAVRSGRQRRLDFNSFIECIILLNFRTLENREQLRFFKDIRKFCSGLTAR